MTSNSNKEYQDKREEWTMLGQNNLLDNKRPRDMSRLALDKRQVKKISRPETRENHKQKHSKRHEYVVVRQEYTKEVKTQKYNRRTILKSRH